ncbi:Cyanovirin-N [Xylariomycetidae sp. FL0641]|nr:Cyanovirin-N [Xylariomycetidae sp. FL0641]
MVSSSLLLLVPMLSATVYGVGGMKSSCKDLEIHKPGPDTFLTAKCIPKLGVPYVCSTLNLNQCYKNDGGLILQEDGGDFGGTCDDCELVNDYYMTCRCIKADTTPDHKYKYTIFLADLIENDDGLLKCYDHVGEECKKDHT